VTAFAQRLRGVAEVEATRCCIADHPRCVSRAVLVVVLRELAAAGPLAPSDLQFMANEIEEAGA
jgi:hypothetical protein